MIKGIAKRVVIVKSPDPRYFEEAIFIVKSDVFKHGKTQQDILREANFAAKRYLAESIQKEKPRKNMPWYFYVLTGAIFPLIAAVIFLVFH